MKPIIVCLALSALAACGGPALQPDEGGASTNAGELAFPGRSGETGSALVDLPSGRRMVSYQVIDGLAIFEGDIILGKAADLARATALGAGAPARDGVAPDSTSRSNTSYRWPNGVVPYEIDSAFSAGQKLSIQAALDHWNNNTPYWFRPRAGESDYMKFVTGSGCSSPVGRQGGEQDVTLASGCSTGNAIHEIGHVVGLWHEQSRADRGSFISINWNNIQQGLSAQFQTYAQQGNDGQDLFGFDFNSIMLYGSFAFSANGMPTMTRLNGTTFNAQRTGLDEEDIAGAVRFLSKNPGSIGYELVNVNSGKCLDVANAAFASGAHVNQYTCSGNSNQRWASFTGWDSNPIMVNDASGHCLDIPDGSTSSGALLQQSSCHGFSNQRFQTVYLSVFPSIVIALKNENSGMCLDVPGASTSDGVQIQQYPCHYGPDQQWRIQF
jgi:hypothetical protein